MSEVTAAEEIAAAVAEVIASGRLSYLNGRKGRELEAAFAAKVGAKHAISCNSGTSALWVALRALDLRPGAEVILPPMSFVSTAHAVLLAGAVPRVVDVAGDAPTLCPEAAEAAIGPRTAALLPVHLFGVPAEMPRLNALAERYSLAVVEDCAQALGSAIDGLACGAWGDAGAFSFAFTKPMTLLGEGGMVTVRAPAVARRAAELRNVGYAHELTDGRWSVGAKGAALGLNLRLLEVQAAAGLVLLPRLDAKLAAQRLNDARLLAVAEGLGLRPYGLPLGASVAYYRLPLRVSADVDRDAAVAELRALGVPADTAYRTPLDAYPFSRGEPGIHPNYEAQRRSLFVIKTDKLDEAGVDRTAAALERVCGAA